MQHTDEHAERWLARAGRALSSHFPLLVMVVGFGFSTAINILATQPDPELMMGGIMASLALPAAIHLWPMVPGGGAGFTGWLRALVRALVMTSIAGMAAYITFRHGAHIMVPAGETDPWDIATGYLYTLITESLVVLGVMAHRAQRGEAGARSVVPIAEPAADVPTTVGELVERANTDTVSVAPPAVEPAAEATPELAPEPVTEPVTQVPDVRSGSLKREKARAEYRRVARDFLAKGKPLDGINAARIDRAVSASVGYSKKHLRAWQAEFEADEQEAVS